MDLAVSVDRVIFEPRHRQCHDLHRHGAFGSSSASKRLCTKRKNSRDGSFDLPGGHWSLVLPGMTDVLRVQVVLCTCLWDGIDVVFPF